MLDRTFKIPAYVPMLIRLNTAWYWHHMTHLLIRYKTLFLILALLLTPTFNELVTLLIYPGRVLLSNPLLPIQSYGIMLLLFQIAGLVWVMLHDGMRREHPFQAQLNLLPCPWFKRIMVTTHLLLLMNGLFLLPLGLSWLALLSEYKNNMIICACISMRFLLVVVSTLVIQQTFLQRRAWLPISKIGSNVSSSHRMPHRYMALLRFLIKHLSQYFHQSSVILVSMCLMTGLSIPILQYHHSERLPIILSIIFFMNALSASNLMKRIHDLWQTHFNFYMTLPRIKIKLALATIAIALLTSALFNGLIILGVLYTNPMLTPILISTLILSALFIGLTYFPQIQYERQGLFLSFLLMIVFIWTNASILI